MEEEPKPPKKKKHSRSHSSTTISFPQDLLKLINHHCTRTGTDRSKATTTLWREELGLDSMRSRKKAEKKPNDEQGDLPLKP